MIEIPKSTMFDKLVEMKATGDKRYPKYMGAYKEVCKEFFGVMFEMVEEMSKAERSPKSAKTFGGATWK